MGTAITEQEFLELERRFWKAMQDRDLETAKSLTDFPCIVSGPQGIGALDEEAFTSMFTSDTARLDRFELKDGARVSRLGDDVAVVAYEAHEELTVEGRPVSLDVAEASTWIRKGGRWVCAQHAEAIEGDPFGRDRMPAGRGGVELGYE